MADNAQNMADIAQNLQDDILNMYQGTLQCYEQLEAVLQQPQYLVNALKTQLIDICFEKIQNLISIEATNVPEENFDADIYHALCLVRQHLLRLKEQKCGFTKPPVTYTAAANQAESPQGQAKSNENAQQLREIIKATQVTPRVKGLQDIGGLTDVKKSLAALIVLPIYQPQLYKGLKICNSILLYGPPGTGKTQLAHALAAEASACLFSVTASDILSHYVGQTEKLVRVLFQTVKEERNSATVLFMDEIDGVCRSRNSTESEWNRRLKTELMCQLSAFENHPNVFLICATNCPWDLDPAFLRRFQRRIYVPLPTRPDRFELLQLLTKDTPLEISSNQWVNLLNKTEGYSGSDLADLVRHALNIPITELINNKRWELTADEMYQPAPDNIDFNSAIYCDLRILPQRSVLARQVHVMDLMAAVDVVKRTVSDGTVRKYEEFISEA